MSDMRQGELLEELRARFGDRCKAPSGGADGALAVVSPVAHAPMLKALSTTIGWGPNV